MRRQPRIDGHHRALDDVGRRALHRRVDRRALGPGALALGALLDVLQVQAAAEHGFDVAALARFVAGALHEIAYARVAPDVQRDVVLRLAATHAQVLRQPDRAHTDPQA